MIRDILHSLKWSSRLGAKFFWAAPAATSGVVFFTLVSQLSMLLAFFLPLKVIILLGSDGIPRYFPPAFEQFDRDALIVWLSAAAVAFYGLYLLAERLITFGAERGARTLLARSRKMVLFENQDEEAAQAYKRHAEIMAAGVFVLLAIAVLYWLYSSVAWLVSGYVVLVAVTLLAGWGISERWRAVLEENLNGWLKVAAGVGFMLAFAYLVIDFLYRDPPGLIPAIIALLLSRQGFSRLESMISALVKQRALRAKLDALFFHGTAFRPERDMNKETIWNLLTPEQRAKWVPEILAEICGEGVPTQVDAHWLQTGVPHVAVLRCDMPDGAGLIIKLYERHRTSLAMHESTLLADAPRGLPSLRWLGGTDFRGFRCHVLELPVGMLDGQSVSAGGVQELRSSLFQVSPSPALITRYTRSRLLLWQRLTHEMLTRIRSVEDGTAAVQAVDALRERLENWRKHLAQMPLAFVSPDIRPMNILLANGDKPRLLHWGRWALEPAGAGWPTSPNDLKALEEACERAAAGRAPDGAVIPEQAKLAAFSTEFERLWQQQQYTRALKSVHQILETLERLDAPIERDETRA